MKRSILRRWKKRKPQILANMNDLKFQIALKQVMNSIQDGWISSGMWGSQEELFAVCSWARPEFVCANLDDFFRMIEEETEEEIKDQVIVGYKY
eukprot:Awhi_evm2s2867